MRPRANAHPLWPALLGLGLAMLAPAQLLATGQLSAGGLAPVALAAVVALFVGAPVAAIAWRHGPLNPTTHGGRGANSLAQLSVAAMVGAAIVPGLPQRGGLLLLACGWLAAALISGLLPRVSLLLALMAGVTAACASAATGVAQASPWTLLLPYWPSWQAWAPQAVVSGLLLSGLAQWTRAPAPAPRPRNLPWLTVGLALLGLLLITLNAALHHESLGLAPSAAPLALGGAVTAALAWLQQPPRGRLGHTATAQQRGHGSYLPAVRSRSLLGLGSGLWLAGPAHSVIPYLWATLLPLSLGLWLLQLARESRGGARWVSALSALLATGAGLAAWPGLPHLPLDAAWLALSVVLVVWLVGTRAVLEPR